MRCGALRVIINGYKTNTIMKINKRQFRLDLYLAIEKAKEYLCMFDYTLNTDAYNDIYAKSCQLFKLNKKEDTTYNVGDCIYYVSGENKALFKGCKYTLLEFALIIALDKYYYIKLKDIENYLKNK